ncbi:MAG: Hsp20/alpha crystallin family protein [Deltaproteobacteria bacterium]|nr:Hsp20/alpha crystallin family protein [Deltaproteobacteria bacterium]
MLSIRKFHFNPIDQVLDSYDVAAREGLSWQCFSPAADVRETADGYALELDLPGFTEKEVEVLLEGKHLTIRGDRKAAQDVQYTRRERGFGAFERVFHLPDDVDPVRIEAKAKNGVLTVTLPKAEASKPKTIKIVGE